MGKSTKALLGLAFMACTSCATVFNGERQSIRINTPVNAKIIVNGDTVSTQNNRITLSFPRSKTPLSIGALHDSVLTTTEIPARNSFMYLANISNYGIGMLIERNSPKRYGYPRTIDLTLKDRNGNTLKQTKTGSVFLTFGIPYVNNFEMHPKSYGPKSSTGFLGLLAGADYYYRENTFANITLDAAIDFELPFIAPLDYFSDYEFMSSLGLSVTNNHVFNRFSFGYGLSFRRNTWGLNRYDSPLPDISTGSNSLGLSVNSYYRIGRTFHAGVVYMPTVYNFQARSALQYEHVLSITFLWKFRI